MSTIRSSAPLAVVVLVIAAALACFSPTALAAPAPSAPGFTPSFDNSPPSANAGPDSTVVDTGNDLVESVTLDGSGSSDTDGEITAFSWMDGSTEIATTVAPVVDLAAGTHTITLTVTDDLGATGTDEVVIIVNRPPAASAGPDQLVTDLDNSGAESVTVDGSASTDPDGSIASFSWKEGATELGTGVQPSFQLAAGSHTIELTITDDLGATATDTLVIIVNRAPVANAGPDQTVTDTDANNAESVTLNGSASTDADGTIAAFIWKEGATELATGEGPTIDFAPGVHTVDLTVTDDHGATATDSILITVNVKPVAEAGPDQTVQDEDGDGAADVTLDGTGSSDSDGSIASYKWKEGASNVASGSSPTVALPVGAHTITLSVTDNHGGIDTDTVEIVIEEQDPQPCTDIPLGSYCVEFYSTNDLSGPILDSGPDAAPLDRDFGTSGPVQGGPVNLFSGRWQGRFDFDKAGTYRFTGLMDDGLRVKIDGEIVFEDWNNHRLAVQFDTLVTAGEHKITIEYYENVGSATIRLDWALRNAAPIANAGPDQRWADFDGNGSQSIKLDGSGSSDDGGPLATIVWLRGATVIATGNLKPTVTLPKGTHTIELRITDAQGLVSKDTVSIIIKSKQPVELKLNKSADIVNANYKVTLTGYPLNAVATVRFNGVIAGTVALDSEGKGSGSFKVPKLPGSVYSISARSGSTIDTAQFTIKPRIKLTPVEGPRGARIQIAITGFTPNEVVQIRWERPNGAFSILRARLPNGTVTTSFAVGADGALTVTVNVPAFSDGGVDKVRVEGTINRMQTGFTVLEP